MFFSMVCRFQTWLESDVGILSHRVYRRKVLYFLVVFCNTPASASDTQFRNCDKAWGPQLFIEPLDYDDLVFVRDVNSPRFRRLLHFF